MTNHASENPEIVSKIIPMQNKKMQLCEPFRQFC